QRLHHRWIALARTPDHHPIPMQPTRRGLAPTTISTHCDRTDSRLVDARFGHTNSPDLGRGWMDCAPACRGHQAAFLGPATPFGISQLRFVAVAATGTETCGVRSRPSI